VSARFGDHAFIALQRLLPQHALSRGIGWLARSRRPWIKRPFIHLFARAYDVDLTEAARQSLADYDSFNDFFTRELDSGARPIAGNHQTGICPADGVLSQAGTVREGRLLQAKGHGYSLATLLGSTEAARRHEGGVFATIYLAPADYHRVHLPVGGELERTCAIPGALFSVNATTEAHIEGLFARNERLVCHFTTDWGPVAVVLIGAMIVAGIQTAWAGPPSPYERVEETLHAGVRFERGAEIGRFLLASTVVVCMPPGAASLLPGLEAGERVRMGQALFRRCSSDHN
jgi:phosphatidylserine decarboxylase